MRWLLVFGIALVACADAEWRTFYGIEYRAPKSSTSHVVDSVLPGPEGLGGSPTGERPTVTVVAKDAFNVTITKSSYAMTLDGMKASYAGNKLGTTFDTKTTSNGWELVGDLSTQGGDPPVLRIHELYVDLATGHYDCLYAEQQCPDPAAAEALCRSIRAK